MRNTLYIASSIIAGILVALGAVMVALFATYAFTAHADISNPHSTPPNNSITHAMLQTGIVDATNLAAGLTLDIGVITAQSSNGLVMFGNASGFATDTALRYDSTNHVLRTTGLITAQASTTLNNVPYQFPSAQGAASTFLKNDGSGNLSWTANAGPTILVASTTQVLVSSGISATTTAFSYTSPAGTFGANDQLRIHVRFLDTTCGSAGTGSQIDFGAGGSTSTIAFPGYLGSGTHGRFADVVLMSAGATNAQSFNMQSYNDLVDTYLHTTGTATIDTTKDANIAFRIRCPGASANMGISGVSIEKIPQT